MAITTKISDIPNLEKQISDLKTEAGTYQDKLNASPTALGGEGTPTDFDVANQESLQRIQGEIQGLTNNILRAKWYPPKSQDLNKTGVSEEPPKLGWFGKGLDFLTRPLYGIVGATKHVIGQGSGDLYQDIADNMMRNKNLFGDVLRSSGVPGAVSAPLGFALDIFADPINWLTMGGGALIPRLGIGAVRGFKTGEGIIKGIGLAAKSGVLEKATTIARYTPLVKKTEAFARLGEKSIAATKTYELLTSSTAADIVSRHGVGVGSYRFGLGDGIKRMAEMVPGGSKFLENFIYDPIEWVRQARAKDIIQESLGVGVDVRAVVKARLLNQPIESFMKRATEQAASKLEEMIPGKMPSLNDIDVDGPIGGMTDLELFKAKSILLDPKLAPVAEKLADAAPDFVRTVDDAVSISKDSAKYISGDPLENAFRIVNEKIGGNPITLEELSRIMNSGALDQTGVRWFDNMMKGIRDYTIKIDRNSDKVVEVGKKTMGFYDRAISIFKVAKVGASPTAWMNAIVGNMAMTHMAGGSIGPEFLGRLKESFNLYRNKPGKRALFDGLLMDAGGGIRGGDIIRGGLRENITATRGTFGGTGFIGGVGKGKKEIADYTTERILMYGRDAGLISAATKIEDVKPGMIDAWKDIMMTYDDKMYEASLRAESGVAMTKRVIEEAGGIENVSRLDVGTGFISQETLNSRVTTEMFKHIREKAKENPGSLSWKLLDYTFNKMPEGYEKIDQTYKMATFVRATVDGYTMNELRRISRLVDINPEEIRTLIKEGQRRYALSSRTALELTNVMYLNYAAMPAAVRILRSMPILDSPFISFMYGMTLKTGQTLAYNPSAFNKVSFGLTEFGGAKTPLEKKALEDPRGYYSYLKQPGMYRLPTKFFDENPMYLNLTNMIPYYSLNMFNPSQAQYGDSVREKLVQAVQSSPVMKGPVGNNLFDFIIQPLILGEAISPQGQFGQPLYPLDATGLEKFGYGMRALGEAFVPNIYTYAGLLTPEAAVEYIPSYRWRQLARAKEGKSQLGITGKEPAVSRTVRTILQASGVPIQAPMNTTFTQK